MGNKIVSFSFNADTTTTGENNVQASLTGLRAACKRRGAPLDSRVEQLAAICANVRNVSKEDADNVAVALNLPAPLIVSYFKQWGISVGQRGKAAIVTPEAVAEAVSTGGVDPADDDAPARIAEILGVKTTAAITKLLVENHGREKGTRGRSADVKFREELHAAYLTYLHAIAESSHKQPHKAALSTALFDLTGDVKSVQHWEAVLPDNGFPIAKGIALADLPEFLAANPAPSYDGDDDDNADA